MRRGRTRLLEESGLSCLCVADILLQPATVGMETLAAASSFALLPARRSRPIMTSLLLLPGIVVSQAVLATAVLMYAVAVAGLSGRRVAMVTGVTLSVHVIMQATLLASPGDWANTALNLTLCMLLVVLPVQVGLRHHAARAARRHQTALELARAVDETRRKLAEQMHDVVAYQVSLIALRASLLDGREDAATLRRESDTISQMAVAALEELRDIIHDLRAPDTGRSGRPSDLLRETVASFAEIHRVDLRIRGDADGLANRLAQVAVNVVREGLVNASKYAPESDIDVSVLVEDGQLRMIVRNSAGNRGTGVLPPGSGTGLANLRNQVDALGGVIEHAPMSGGGFRLAVTAPLESGITRPCVASGESCNLS